MNIPDKFKKVIKSTFYDKTVELYSISRTVEADGAVTKSETATKTGEFLGNVKTAGFEAIQESYGIKEDIEIAITTDESVQLNQIIKYSNRFYEITEAIPTDSHNLLVGKKCLLKLST